MLKAEKTLRLPGPTRRAIQPSRWPRARLLRATTMGVSLGKSSRIPVCMAEGYADRSWSCSPHRGAPAAPKGFSPSGVSPKVAQSLRCIDTDSGTLLPRAATCACRFAENRGICHRISEYLVGETERWAGLAADGRAGGPRSRAAPSSSTSTPCAAEAALPDNAL
jgi:hypothetical protein